MHLVVDLDYIKPGEISLSMINYIKEMLDTFPKQQKINKKIVAQVATYLFEVRETTKLNLQQAKILYHITTKTLIYE